MSFGGLGVFGASIGVNIGGSSGATENPSAGVTAQVPIGSLTGQIISLLRSLPVSQLTPAQVQFLNLYTPTKVNPIAPPTANPIVSQPGPGIPVGRVVPVVPQPAPPIPTSPVITVQPKAVTPVATTSLMNTRTVGDNTLTIPSRFTPGSLLSLPGPYEVGGLITRATAPIQRKILKHTPDILEAFTPGPVKAGVRLIRSQAGRMKPSGKKSCDCEALIEALCSCDCAGKIKGAKPARGGKPRAAGKPHVPTRRLAKRHPRAKAPAPRIGKRTPLQKIRQLIHQHSDLTPTEKKNLLQLAQRSTPKAQQKALDDCLKRLQDLEDRYSQTEAGQAELYG